jgi:hypothetical protein
MNKLPAPAETKTFEHTLSGLVAKRAITAGKIEHAQAALRKLVQELDTLDAAIRIFDPDADIPTIRAKQYPPRHAAFRGEMMRFVMGALRDATGPLTTRDIAIQVMDERGLDPDQADTLLMIRKRVGACIYKLARQGIVRERPSNGDLKMWVKP